MSIIEAYRTHLCTQCENFKGCTQQLNVVHDEQQNLSSVKCPEYKRVQIEEVAK